MSGGRAFEDRGAGEFAAADEACFHRFARCSATESAAISDALAALELPERDVRESLAARRGKLDPHDMMAA